MGIPHVNPKTSIMGILAEAAYKCNWPLLSKLIKSPVLKYALNQCRLRNKR
jgi:hypothetical protein